MKLDWFSGGSVGKMLAQMAWRNISRNRKRSAVVIAAAMVGFIGICLTIGFMNGYKDMMLGTAVESGLGHLQIRPAGYSKVRDSGLVLENSASVLKKLETAKISTLSYAPRIEREGMLRLDTRTRGVQILGVDPQREKKVSRFFSWLTEGSWLEGDDSLTVPIIIGKINGRKFEIETGDTIVLTFTTKNGTMKSVLARVAGFFASPAEPIDKYTVLMDIRKLASLVFGNPETVQYVSLTGDHNKESEMLGSWKASLEHLFPENEILTYKDLQPGISKLLDLSDQMMGIFYFIMLSGFGLILLNTVLMSVMERTHEIGILIALGTKSKFLIMLVALESLFMTFVGVLIAIMNHTGLDLSMFAKGMERMANTGTTVYPDIFLSDFGSATMVALVIAILASLYPARKAVNIEPAKAMRMEA